jgi:hypothetical protein
MTIREAPEFPIACCTLFKILMHCSASQSWRKREDGKNGGKGKQADCGWANVNDHRGGPRVSNGRPHALQDLDALLIMPVMEQTERRKKEGKSENMWVVGGSRQ